MKFTVEEERGRMGLEFSREGETISVSSWYDGSYAGAECKICLSDFLSKLEFSRRGGDQSGTEIGALRQQNPDPVSSLALSTSEGETTK